MDLTQLDPERQRRRLRLLAELAEARAVRDARLRGIRWRAGNARASRSERIQELVAYRKRLVG